MTPCTDARVYIRRDGRPVHRHPPAVCHGLKAQDLNADCQERKAAKAAECIAGGKAGDAAKRQLLTERAG